MIGANVVIADNRTVVTPELYVADAKSRDAEELAGYHSLSAISQYGRSDDNPAVRRAIRRALLQEVRGAASFVLGLGLYNRGEFQEASARFTAALDSWTDDRERALAYLFLGNTAGRRDDLSQARTYYRKAMQVSPDYVRASLGLAELAYQEGHGTCERKSIDAKKLLSALERYKAISDQLQQTSTLSLKATFGVGRVHLCLSQSGTRSAWAEAEKAFRMVASASDTSQRVQELASESYASLGLIYMPPVRAPQPEPYYRRAEQAYRKAVELSPSAARQALFLSIIGHIQERLGDAQEACKAYHRASSLDPSRAEYTASRRRLDGCQ